MNDNYPTPRWLMQIFSGWFDPCPLNSNFENDGLSIDWLHRTYVNPPYSDPYPWVSKAIEESKKGKTIAMLLPVDTSTKWFRMLIEANAHIFYHHGRLSFNGSPPRFASMLVILEKETSEKP